MQAITKEELKKMNSERHEDFVLINVLPREYFNKAHIRTSVNIPHDQPDFARKVEEAAGSKERKIVLYCASFDCDASPKAAKKLEQAGFKKVYDYEGGTKDWEEDKPSKAAA